MFLVSWKLMKAVLLIPNVNLILFHICRWRYQLQYTNFLIKFCQKTAENHLRCRQSLSKKPNWCILEIVVKICQWLACVFSRWWLGETRKKHRALDRNRTDDIPIFRSCALLPITFFFLWNGSQGRSALKLYSPLFRVEVHFFSEVTISTHDYKRLVQEATPVTVKLR